MQFTREPITGYYRAVSDAFVYQVGRNADDRSAGWFVAVYERNDVAGVTICGERVDIELVDTLADAKRFAQGYDDNVFVTEKPYLNRATRAMQFAYDV